MTFIRSLQESLVHLKEHSCRGVGVQLTSTVTSTVTFTAGNSYSGKISTNYNFLVIHIG